MRRAAAVPQSSIGTYVSKSILAGGVLVNALTADSFRSPSPRRSAASPTATRLPARPAQAGSRNQATNLPTSSSPDLPASHPFPRRDTGRPDRVQHRIDLPGQRGDQRRHRRIRSHPLNIPSWVRSTAISAAQSPPRRRLRLNTQLSRIVDRLWPAPRSQPSRQLPGTVQRNGPSLPAATQPRARPKTRHR